MYQRCLTTWGARIDTHFRWDGGWNRGCGMRETCVTTRVERDASERRAWYPSPWRTPGMGHTKDAKHAEVANERLARRRHTMATQFETIPVEEQAGTEPVSQPTPSRFSRGRIAALALGSVSLSLAATAAAFWAARRQRQLRGGRRGRVLNIQPRVAVFAPALTISLPFSSIESRAASGRNRGRRIGPVPFVWPRGIVERRGRTARSRRP